MAAWTLAVLLLSWTLGVAPAAAADNIVLMLLDDTRATDIAGMPTVQQLAREGTTFDHAYSSDPMCAPARAIIQTGLYTHRNGVTQNGIQQFVQSQVAPRGGLQAVPQGSDLDRTFAVALHATGVYTGFVGKFINGAAKVVPGWDYVCRARAVTGRRLLGVLRLPAAHRRQGGRARALAERLLDRRLSRPRPEGRPGGGGGAPVIS